jgi:hypothetical protein
MLGCDPATSSAGALLKNEVSYKFKDNEQDYTDASLRARRSPDRSAGQEDEFTLDMLYSRIVMYRLIKDGHPE